PASSIAIITDVFPWPCNWGISRSVDLYVVDTRQSVPCRPGMRTRDQVCGSSLNGPYFLSQELGEIMGPDTESYRACPNLDCWVLLAGRQQLFPGEHLARERVAGASRPRTRRRLSEIIGGISSLSNAGPRGSPSMNSLMAHAHGNRYDSPARV